MNRNILATAIFAAAALTASAQQLSQEIDVTHDIVPTHRQANRPQQMPVIGLNPVSPSPIENSQRMTSAPVVPTASFYQPAAWNDTLPTSPYRGYLMAAYWPVYHVGASAGYRFVDNDHTRLSAWGQFNGANYKSGGIEHRHSTTALGMDLHQAVGKRSYFDAGIDYRFSSFNPYYEIPADLYRIDGTWHQYVNAVNVAAAWHSSIQSLKYNVYASYGYFGYRNQLPWYAWPDALDSEAREPIRQSVMDIRADALMPFTETSSIGLDVGYTMSFSPRSSVARYSMGADEGYQLSDTGESYNNGILSLTPRYQLRSNAFNLDAGLNVDFVIHGGTVLRLSPDVRIDWHPAKIVTVTGTVTGGTRLNTLASLYNVNYLNAPMIAYSQSYVPYDAEIALTVGPQKAIYGRLSFAYARADDWLMPQLHGHTSLFASQDIKGWKAGLAVGAAYRDFATLEAHVEAAPQEYDKGWYIWRDRAKYVAGVDLTVRPIKPLDVTVGWELRARRAIIDSHFSLLPEPRATYTYQDLGNISNLNLAGTYRLTEQLSLFATFNNLLSRKVTMIGGIPYEGFNGLIGASYKF